MSRVGRSVASQESSSRFRAFCSLGFLSVALSCDVGDAAAPSFAPVEVVPPRDFTSGTRLRARFHRVEGAVDVLASFHDTKLDLDCAFTSETGPHVGPAASSYCLPAGVARHREGRGPYLDAACKELAAFAPIDVVGGAAPATLAWIEPRDACATVPVARAALPPSLRRAYVRDDAGTCQQAQRSSLHALGDVLAPDTFVRAVERAEPRAGRIDARVLVGDDGSRLVVGGFDRFQNEAVTIAELGDGARRWAPSRMAFVGAGEPLFVDNGCKTSLAAKIGRTATCPIATILVFENNCGAGSLFRARERVSSAFAMRGSGCESVPVPDSLLFTVGAPIDRTSFARVDSIDLGTTRVRRRGLRADGDVVAWGPTIDAATGEPCQVLPIADGTLRCLPDAVAVADFFSDEACTAPAIAVADNGCARVTPRFIRGVSSTGVDAPPRTFEVIGERSAIYSSSGGSCRRYLPPVTSQLFALREVSVERFPRAEEMQE